MGLYIMMVKVASNQMLNFFGAKRIVERLDVLFVGEDCLKTGILLRCAVKVLGIDCHGR